MKFTLEGGIKWKGSGYEKLQHLSKHELVEYIKKLENALYLVHSHFWFGDVNVDTNNKDVTFGTVGCDFNWVSMGVPLTAACLEMYRMHDTPFCPVKKPIEK